MARYQHVEQRKRRRVEIVKGAVEEENGPQCSSNVILVDMK